MIRTRTGKGGTIAADAPRLSDRERKARVLAATREYATAIKRLGSDRDQAVAALREVY